MCKHTPTTTFKTLLQFLFNVLLPANSLLGTETRQVQSRRKPLIKSTQSIRITIDNKDNESQAPKSVCSLCVIAT